MKVPGVGRKARAAPRRSTSRTVSSSTVVDLGSATSSGPTWEGQVHALIGLGWSPREADAAVAVVAEDVEPDADVATVLRLALRSLDRA